jgi:hypothetical protein
MDNEYLNIIREWANKNSGFTAIIIFAITLFLGWISGIFKALRKKPKFKISLLETPTFCSTLETGKKYKGMDIHKTAISLYLKVSNIGSAPSQISEVKVGYKNYDPRYILKKFWLHQTVIVKDFQQKLGNHVRVFPFLIQKNYLIPDKIDTYLNIGSEVNGIVYFEQPLSFGGFRPRIKNNKIKIIVKIKDAFGKYHSNNFWVPCIDIEEARKYNSEFGKTGFEEGEKNNYNRYVR